jgi:hypothetical protein
VAIVRTEEKVMQRTRSGTHVLSSTKAPGPGDKRNVARVSLQTANKLKTRSKIPTKDSAGLLKQLSISPMLTFGLQEDTVLGRGNDEL